MNVITLLESAGWVGQAAVIGAVVAMVISTLLAVTLAFRRIAPVFVVGPLALLVVVANGFAAFRVWGLREALFNTSSLQRAQTLELALRESPAAMGAGALAAMGGGLLVLVILAAADLLATDGESRWTPTEAAPALIGGIVGGAWAGLAGHPLLAVCLVAVSVLAAVASVRRPMHSDRPRFDAWRAVAALCAVLVGLGCASLVFCEELLDVYRTASQTGQAVSAQGIQTALEALSWRRGAAPVLATVIGVVTSWAVCRPPHRGVRGFLVGAVLVGVAGGSALVAADEMVDTLTGLHDAFDSDGLHLMERRMDIELPRVADGKRLTPRIDVVIGRRGIEVADVPLVTLRANPLGREFPATQIKRGVVPVITDHLNGLLESARTTGIPADEPGRVTLWADQSEAWSVVRVVLASVYSTQSLHVEVAAVVSQSHVTAFPLDRSDARPTVRLHPDGRLEDLEPGEGVVLLIDDDTPLGAVVAALDDNPGATFHLE